MVFNIRHALITDVRFLPGALVLCFLLGPLSLSAQKKPPVTGNTTTPTSTTTTTTSTAPAPPPPVSDSTIYRLFDKGATGIKWIKRLKGRVDDVYLVDITLGYDGHFCRGYMTYVKSKTRFKLEGTLDQDQIQLAERDPVGVNTGQLEGTFNGTKLEANWNNTSNTVGSRIVAEELQPGQTMITSCSENKWAGRYICRYNGARADMVLIRLHNGSMEGFLWIEADNKSYTLKGDLKDDNTYEMEALLPSGKTAGLLQGNLKNPGAIECNWVGSGERRTFPFAQKDKLVFGCLEYADYRSGYDAVYPRTACIDCNSWLDQQINTWMGQCRTAMAAVKEPLNATTRNAYRASCWADIACWTETVFSGYLTFTDTWNPQAQGKSFNFDLKKGKEITFADLFNKSFNAQPWLDDYAKKESPKLPQFASDPQYREWVDKEGFPLYTLRRDGLELSTLFHPVYGQQHIMVPYSVLKPYMRKDNPVSEFVK
ncbi:MAG: hypothetical protein WCR52_07550 [Bacteroidota bacterium]